MGLSTHKKKRGITAAGSDNSPSGNTEPRRADRPKRENFKFPERTAKELERISEESGITKTEVVRQGIALMRVCWDESKVGNRIVVQNAAGELVKELVLP
jgi:hypothetical protein